MNRKIVCKSGARCRSTTTSTSSLRSRWRQPVVDTSPSDRRRCASNAARRPTARDGRPRGPPTTSTSTRRRGSGVRSWHPSSRFWWSAITASAKRNSSASLRLPAPSTPCRQVSRNVYTSPLSGKQASHKPQTPPRCCHSESYFKRPKSSPVRPRTEPRP